MATEPVILRLTPEETSNKTVFQLYMTVGTRLGYQSDSDHVYFDCCKLNIAQNIQNNIFAAYRKENAAAFGASPEEFNRCVAGLLLRSGPKVNDALPDNAVEVMPGFVQDKDGTPLTPAQSYCYGAFIKDFSLLPGKADILAWLKEHGDDDRGMAEVRQKYEKRTGCDPSMLYPYFDGRFLGGNIMPVKEGILYIPYSAQDPSAYELYETDCAVLLDAATCRRLIEAADRSAAELSRTLKRALTITTLQQNAREVSGEREIAPPWMPLEYIQKGS